jgi:hypothetical protein
MELMLFICELCALNNGHLRRESGLKVGLQPQQGVNKTA